MAATRIAIDRKASSARIAQDIETLSGPDFTLSSEAIRRYAYTNVYENALRWFTAELEQIGFAVERDPVGTLVARNRPKGETVYGIGSHCDSNRNGISHHPAEDAKPEDAAVAVEVALNAIRSLASR